LTGDDSAASRFGDEFRLTLITNDPVLAARADAAGVDRVGVDLERLGKAERQAAEDTRLSEHRLDDLAVVARPLANADLFVRLNPFGPGTPLEMEAALQRGAKVVMLPFFRTANEVDRFVRLADGRAHIVILLETATAVLRIREVLAVPGIGEVMLGLNDLRLQFGVRSHFEVLASPLVDMLADEVRRVGLPLGVGGVARADDRGLPIDPDLVYAQFPRLGATGAWLSRSFFRGVSPEWEFGAAVRAVRGRLSHWARASPTELERARELLALQARRAAGMTDPADDRLDNL
jgi:2-keto-3-deoxy-L-rhamnonate aldolase RhmA